MRRATLLDRLCELYPDRGREQWYAAIACGEVRVNGERVRDPQRPIMVGAAVECIHEPPLASRAGYKLQHALARFGVSVAGRVLLDAGSATGGFTDCLLRHGARHVHCVDVAHGALTYRLREDPRTSVHERTNVMHLSAGSLQPPPDGAVCDLSFRSLRGAAARLLGLTGENWLVALIKPQFELAAAPGTRGSGIRFDGRVIGTDAITAVVTALVRDLAVEGVMVRGCTPAPVRGRRGNREVLALLTAGARPAAEAVWADAVATLRQELRQSAGTAAVTGGSRARLLRCRGGAEEPGAADRFADVGALGPEELDPSAVDQNLHHLHTGKLGCREHDLL